jgi:hypothetical protein
LEKKDMKLLFTILLLAAFVFTAQAQETREAQESKEAKAVIKAKEVKVYTELITSSERIVKGAPFSAEGVNESVQTLADGNRIVRTSSTRMYRDGEGRFRRQGSASTGGMLGSYFSVSSTTITDPVAGFRFFLNDKERTARRSPLKPVGEMKLLSGYQGTLTASQKIQAELGTVYAAKASPQAQAELERVMQTKAVIATNLPSGQMTVAHAAVETGADGMKTETKTESLGTKDFDGVEAEGTRTTTTMPAGMIGNERPIEVVYEHWYSKDLQLTVYSKHSDPRFGEQTYRLANINRSEPDPSVFAVPADYKILTEPASAASPLIYKLSTAPTPSSPPPPATAPTAPVKATPASKKVQ